MEVEKKQYIMQRRIIGFMVILLAPLSVLFGLIGCKTNPSGWWYSISATYYANSKIIMIGIITISAFFFCTYKGYDWRDRVVNLISGIGLFGILVFPCYIEGYTNVGLFNLSVAVSDKIHSALALIAFLGFFVNEMFIFTLNNGEITKEKKRRNLIYRICSCGVLVAAILIALGNFPSVKMPKNTVWIAELVALVPCGFAWLVKGEALSFLNDK